MNGKIPLILVGGGGHCKSVIDVIETNDQFEVKGILDRPEKIRKEILGYKIIDEDINIDYYVKKGYYFLVTVGQIKSPEIRRAIYNKIKNSGGKLPVVISGGAYISENSVIGDGTVIHHGAVINADTRIGKNCIINTRSIIEHDSSIGDHCHVSTNATINGNVSIEQGVFIGSGSTIIQGVSIGKNSVIGAGSIVFKDVGMEKVVIGNPAKSIRK